MEPQKLRLKLYQHLSTNRLYADFVLSLIRGPILSLKDNFLHLPQQATPKSKFQLANNVI